MAQLVADLDNDDFTEREKATAELAKRGRKVEAELREAYEKQPSAEMRYRLQNLLGRLKDAPSEETAKVGRSGAGDHRRRRSSRLPRNLGERAAGFARDEGSQGVVTTAERALARPFRT